MVIAGRGAWWGGDTASVAVEVGFEGGGEEEVGLAVWLVREEAAGELLGQALRLAVEGAVGVDGQGGDKFG